MMMKRLILALLALVLAAVAAVAGDTIGGGEGGAINLPGGRNGSSMQSIGGGSTSEWLVGTKSHLRLRVTPDMATALVILRPMDLPFTQMLTPVDGVITVTLDSLLTLRGAGEAGFTLDLVAAGGSHLRVTAKFVDADQMRVTAE